MKRTRGRRTRGTWKHPSWGFSAKLLLKKSYRSTTSHWLWTSTWTVPSNWSRSTCPTVLQCQVTISCTATNPFLLFLASVLPDTEKIYQAVFTDICKRYGKPFPLETRLRVLGTTERRSCAITVEDCKLPITVDEFVKQYKELTLSRLGNAPLLRGTVIYNVAFLHTFMAWLTRFFLLCEIKFWIIISTHRT